MPCHAAGSGFCAVGQAGPGLEQGLDLVHNYSRAPSAPSVKSSAVQVMCSGRDRWRHQNKIQPSELCTEPTHATALDDIGQERVKNTGEGNVVTRRHDTT